MQVQYTKSTIDSDPQPAANRKREVSPTVDAMNPNEAAKNYIMS
jgi:hypothetical protein